MRIKKFDQHINEADEESVKGLLCFVYRAAHGSDATAKGLTSKVDQVFLTNDDIGLDGPFKIKPGEDYLVLIERKNPGFLKGSLYAVPKSILDSGEHSMFGGNFVYSSDSKFYAISKYPIPVHDRVER